jgi:hypothetical protein
MDKNEASMIIEQHICKEIIQIAENIKKTNSMSIQDLEKLDKLYHAWKSKLTAEAMIEAEESLDNEVINDENQNGISGYRSRLSNRRATSRMSGAYDNGYADGYSYGYSEAMNSTREGMSGHYPITNNNYGPRRW